MLISECNLMRPVSIAVPGSPDFFITKVSKRTVSISDGVLEIGLVDPARLIPRDPFAVVRSHNNTTS